MHAHIKSEQRRPKDMEICLTRVLNVGNGQMGVIWVCFARGGEGRKIRVEKMHFEQYSAQQLHHPDPRQISFSTNIFIHSHITTHPKLNSA